MVTSAGSSSLGDSINFRNDILSKLYKRATGINPQLLGNSDEFVLNRITYTIHFDCSSLYLTNQVAPDESLCLTSEVSDQLSAKAPCIPFLLILKAMLLRELS